MDRLVELARPEGGRMTPAENDDDQDGIDRGLDGLGYDKHGNYNPNNDQSPDAPKPPTSKRSGKLPAWTPDEGDPAGRYAAWLNELWNLTNGRDPFIRGERFGKHGDAAIVLVRQSGQRVRWTHQSTLTKPAGLQSVLMSECGIKPRKLTGYDAMLIAWAITQLADLRADLDVMEEVALWWLHYVDTRPTRSGNPDEERGWRTLLAEWQAARSFDEIRGKEEPHRTFIVVDDRDGVRYVRREDYADHVRGMVRGSLSWPTLNSRLAEAGWQQTRFQRRATAGGAPYVEARLYVVPADWPEPELAETLAAKVGT
jgi:hypothetical protein